MEGHDSRAIANTFVEMAQKANRRLTIMPLVKYVYFAHGWTLGITGKPLICHKVLAWKHGPVIPQVYYEFRSYGMVVKEKAKNWLGIPYKAKLDDEQKEIVRQVYEAYSRFEPWELSGITHKENSPWHQFRYKEFNAVIADNVIREYYAKLANPASE